MEEDINRLVSKLYVVCLLEHITDIDLLNAQW